MLVFLNSNTRPHASILMLSFTLQSRETPLCLGGFAVVSLVPWFKSYVQTHDSIWSRKKALFLELLFPNNCLFLLFFSVMFDLTTFPYVFVQ